jgi:hypothetical protein
MVEGRFLYAAEPGAFLLSVLDELTNPRSLDCAGPQQRRYLVKQM